MRSKEFLSSLVRQITPNEPVEERQAIAYLLLEKRAGFSKADILTNVELDFLPDLQLEISRINAHEPVQYVLGEADFFGRVFVVNPSVLIPRPETEQLVSLALEWLKNSQTKPRILDIGTGSGCIAVTLALQCFSEVFATDISKGALETARENARLHEADVTFINNNILSESIPVKGLDLVISNPPYIAEEEKPGMKKNVLDHEPSLALFVPDNDPLCFYKAIASAGVKALRKNGVCMVEINERRGPETAVVFRAAGFTKVETVNDLHGKSRFVIASR